MASLQTFRTRTTFTALCSFSLLSIFALSCSRGLTSRSGSATPSGDNTPNTLTATPSSTTFNVMEEVASQSIQIRFAPSKGSISGFSAFLPKNVSSEWTLDMSKCPATLTAGCDATLTYTPTSQAGESGNIVVSYNYIDSKGNRFTNKALPTMTYTASSLLTTTSLPQEDLSQISQINFSNSLPSMALSKTGHFFAPTMTSPVENIDSYTPTSSGNVVLQNNNSGFPIISIYDMANNAQITLSNINNYAVGKSLVYGALNGKIYAFDPKNPTNEPTTLPSSSTMIQSLFVDTSSPNEVVYSLATNGDVNNNEVLCVSSNEGSSCTPETVANSDSWPTFIASHGAAYVQTNENGKVKISAHTAANLSTPSFTPFSTPGSGTVPMVYDAINKVLYALIYNNGAYTLQAIDASTGIAKWSHPFANSEAISAPFLSQKTGRVVVVGSSGKVYGFKAEGTTAFASGNSYNLPVSNPQVSLITLDSTSGKLNIPSSTVGGGAVVYSMNLQW